MDIRKLPAPTIDPRSYQIDAIEAEFDAAARGVSRMLTVVFTGGGKSAIMAMSLRTGHAVYNHQRSLILAPRAELVHQNVRSLKMICPGLTDNEIGVVTEGADPSELQKMFVVGTYASAYNRSGSFPIFDAVKVDEAQHTQAKDAGMLGTCLKTVQANNPDCIITGLTATPFRYGGGCLVNKVGAYEEITFDYGLAQAIEDGYAAPLVTVEAEGAYDVDSVGSDGIDFNQKQLSHAIASQHQNTAAAVEYFANEASQRQHWIAFGVDLNHCEVIQEMFTDLGIPSALYVGVTSKKERKQILADYAAGKYRCLISRDVLGVGFDYPGVDAILMARPTESPVVLVQFCGRGTRIAPGKKDCLVIDAAGNFARLGPVDMPFPTGGDSWGGNGWGNSSPPVKKCPGTLPGGAVCNALVAPTALTCSRCGYQFPPADHEDKIFLPDDDTAALSGELLKQQWYDVHQVNYGVHSKKTDPSKLTFKVRHFTKLSDGNLGPMVTEYWPIGRPQDQGGFIADKRWRQRAINPNLAVPKSPLEASQRTNELAVPKRILVGADPKNIRFDRIFAIEM